MTSSKYGSFLERSLPVVFAPGRNTGMQLMNNHFDQRMTWAVGVFREVGSFGVEMCGPWPDALLQPVE